MPQDASPSSPWQLDTNRAHLHTARFQAQCETQSLFDGFHALKVADQECEGRVWQVTSPLIKDRKNSLADSYIRKNDLILSYAATREFPFSTQLDWRVERDDRETLSIATIISVQTDLLDTHPVIELTCELPTDEVLLLPANALDGNSIPAKLPLALPEEAVSQLVLFRIADSDFTYAEAIDPSDFCGLKLLEADTGHTRCTWRLFLHFLEKGVIRRTRLCSMLVPRTNDVQHASRAFREFLASELPLTA